MSLNVSERNRIILTLEDAVSLPRLVIASPGMLLLVLDSTVFARRHHRGKLQED